jgi:hypothetical protein
MDIIYQSLCSCSSITLHNNQARLLFDSPTAGVILNLVGSTFIEGIPPSDNSVPLALNKASSVR